jgi:hypothetical protein
VCAFAKYKWSENVVKRIERNCQKRSKVVGGNGSEHESTSGDTQEESADGGDLGVRREAEGDGSVRRLRGGGSSRGNRACGVARRAQERLQGDMSIAFQTEVGKLTLITLLTGAVAVLRALLREEEALAAEELAPAEDEEKPAAMVEASEAGMVVATPPMVVVTRSDRDDAMDEVTEAETGFRK